MDKPFSALSSSPAGKEMEERYGRVCVDPDPGFDPSSAEKRLNPQEGVSP